MIASKMFGLLCQAPTTEVADLRRLLQNETNLRKASEEEASNLRVQLMQSKKREVIPIVNVLFDALKLFCYPLSVDSKLTLSLISRQRQILKF